MNWQRAKFIGALIAGLGGGMLLVSLLEFGTIRLFPLPPGIDPTNEDHLRQAVKEGKIPLGALTCVLVAWIIGAGTGSWISARLAPHGKRWSGLFVGGFFYLCSLTMLYQIPHPLPLAIGAIVLIPAWVWLGVSLATQSGVFAPRIEKSVLAG